MTMDLSKCLCCCGCCRNNTNTPSVQYTKLNHKEEERKTPRFFKFPQGPVGSFYPPMFENEELSKKRLASPHVKKLTGVVMDQPKALQNVKSHYIRKGTTLRMDQPPAVKWRMDSPNAKTLAQITGIEPSTSVQHELRETNTDTKPTLQFALEYDACHAILKVHLLSAANLPAMDLCGTSDPYVTICLFPSQEKYSSKIMIKSLNPKFDEKFCFRNVYWADIGSMMLHFDVFDSDKVTRDDKIGSVIVSPDDTDLSGKMLTYEITKSKTMTSTDNRGTILLSLSFDDYYNRLNGRIVRLGKLPAMDVIKGTSDPYVKVQLLHNEKIWKDWTSSIKKRTKDPIFHEPFWFNPPEDSINDCQLRITVYDYDHMKPDDIIGVVCIGAKAAQADARRHWDEMLVSTQAVCRWHSIMSTHNIGAKTKVAS